MKAFKKTKACLTVLSTFTKSTINLLILTVCIVLTCNHVYSEDNSTISSRVGLTTYDANLEFINLKGFSEVNKDILEWQVSDISGVVEFSIQCCNTNDMVFHDIERITPLECNTNLNGTAFTHVIKNNSLEGIVYYKVKVTFKDKHVLESNFICIKRTESINNLSISKIQNQDGQLSMSFMSPKTQYVTLNIFTKSGQLVTVKELNAAQGENTFSFETAHLNSTEMLIFILNNNEEQITKKYMLASVW